MAGTVTVTREEIKPSQRNTKHVTKVIVDWTSDADGDADVAIKNLSGWLVKVVTDPGSSAPTDNYDVTLIDEDGADALQSLCLNRDTSNSESVYTLVTGAATPVLLAGTHTFTVANAGNAASGRAVLYMVESL